VEERENNKWVEGVELIARKLHTMLEQEGVQPIEALNQPFDPNLHEAVAFAQQSLIVFVLQRAHPQVMGDLDACVAWARAQGADTTKLGVTGFCWGGRIAWLYVAHQPAVKAGVAWYGKLVSPVTALQPVHPVDVAARLNAPVLGLYGGQDAGIPLDSVDRMKAALAQGSAAAKRSEFVVYPDAPHAFHADYRPSYKKDAADDGWRRCVAWFKANGVA